VVSALLRHGAGYVTTLRKGLEDWLEWQKMHTLDEARGLMKIANSDSASFERGHYIRTLHTWLP
jgi:dihydroorotate dehydrogenase (fumarate)